MATTIHVEMKALPDAIRRALSAVGCNERDLPVTPKEETYLSDNGGDGYRSFVAIVNLTTGEHAITWGSWGGPNMFNPSNPVDLDPRRYTIPPNGAVVKGRVGGTQRTARCSVEIHPSNLTPLLPPSIPLDDREKAILRAFTLKSGPYRTEDLRHAKATEADLDSLAAKGLLKRSKNGATQLTATGRNVMGR